MASNFNFRTTLSLNAAEFKKGVESVKKSLSGLKSTFLSVAGALGAGLGLSKVVGEIKSTATKLDTAKMTLENVSKGIGEYGENMVWLRQISNKYGQDLLTLTNSFAQFRAASDASSLSVGQMRDIFESLTRAAGAYHMSADRTNDMMIATTQMMSKGRVCAEELRRQLGNSLPGAFNIMTKAAYAAGIITEDSTAALEKAMKAGKVAAEDVLPSFARMLNQVTANANFDSLQSALNRLKNTWTEFVEEGNFTELLKKMVNGANTALSAIGNNFNNLKRVAIAAIAGITSAKLWKRASDNFVAYTNEQAAAFDSATRKVNGLNSQIQKYQKTYQGLIKSAKGTGGGVTIDPNYPQPVVGQSAQDYRKVINAAIEYNNALIKQKEASMALLGPSKKYRAEIRALTKENEVLAGRIQTSGQILNDMGTTGGKITAKLVNAFRSLGMAIKAAFTSIAIGAIIAGVTALISKFVQLHKEAKAIADIPKNASIDVQKIEASVDDDMVTLTSIKKILSETNGDLKNQAKNIETVNDKLGLTGDKAFTIESNVDDICSAIDTWIAKLKAVAVQQALIGKISELTAKNITLQSENAAKTRDENYGKTSKQLKIKRVGDTPMPYFEEDLTPAAKKIQKEIEKNNKIIEANTKAIDGLMHPDDDMLKAMGLTREEFDKMINEAWTKNNGSGNNGGDGGGAAKGTPSAAISEYNKKAGELKNQFDNGAISAEEYHDKLADAVKETYLALTAFGAWEDVMKKLSGKDKSTAESIKDDFGTNQIIEEVGKAIEEDEKKLGKEIEDSIKKEDEKFKKDMEESLKHFDNYIKDVFRKEPPKEGKRDQHQDYKYNFVPQEGMAFSEAQIKAISETVDIKLNYADELEKFIKDLEDGVRNGDYGELKGDVIKQINKLKTALAEAKGEATSLQDILNFSEAQQSIIDLEKEWNEAATNSLTSLAQSLDRVTDSLWSIAEAFDEDVKDSDLYKYTSQFFSVLNAGIQIIESVTTVVKAMQTAEEIYAKMKQQEAVKVAAADAAIAAAEGTKATATAGAAVAGAASSVASVPIVGPALAVAAVAAIIAAMMAGMSKFANGGIIGGNSTHGDKQTARVNSGEMILNKAQQGTLWRMINGGGVGGDVQFKIRGSDLVGTINNYNSKMRG